MNKTTEKLPSLDGWRAISITMVLLAHSAFTPGFPKALINWVDTLGYAGVRFFFVISGFLITFLLLNERALHGSLSLKNFYLRRVLRIFPVYMFYLLFVFLFTKYSQPDLSWIANLTFTTNYLSFAPGPPAHLWSLAVEEQFYIIWPWIVFFLLQRKATPAKLLYCLSVPILVAPIFRVLDCKQWYPENLQNLFHSGSFFAVFDWLAYGSATAIFFFYWPNRIKSFLNKKFKLVLLIGLLLVFVPAIQSALHLPARIRALTSESLQATGFCLLLLQSVYFADSKIYRGLNFKFIKFFGVLSYSIYVWHGLFCSNQEIVFGSQNAWCGNFPIWILMSVLVACASYYCLEKPFMSLRTKLRRT